MAEFPVTKPEFIVPSCVNLSTYIQGMSDYEVRCYYTQLVQQWATEWAQMQTQWSSQQQAFEDFKTYVNNKLQTFQEWFDNLDVQTEINNKIDEMVSDGSFLAIIQSTVNSQTRSAADTWLEENMTPGSGAPALDSSFTLTNAAAQSKAVGDYLLPRFLKTNVSLKYVTIKDFRDWVSSNGVVQPCGSLGFVGIKVPVTPSSKLSFYQPSNFSIAFYTGNDTFVAGYNSAGGITVPSTAAYCIVPIYYTLIPFVTYGTNQLLLNYAPPNMSSSTVLSQSSNTVGLKVNPVTTTKPGSVYSYITESYVVSRAIFTNYDDLYTAVSWFDSSDFESNLNVCVGYSPIDDSAFIITVDGRSYIRGLSEFTTTIVDSETPFTGNYIHVTIVDGVISVTDGTTSKKYTIPKGFILKTGAAFTPVGHDVVSVVKLNNYIKPWSNWFGKQWYAYGTSLTSVQQGEYATPTANALGAVLTNKGIPGAGLVSDKRLYNALMSDTDGKENADFITIECGANDASSPLGSPTSFDTGTILGALNTCIKHISETYLNAKIIVLSSTFSVRNLDSPPDIYELNTVLPGGYTYLERELGLMQLCLANGIEFIQLESCGGSFYQCHNTQFTLDNIHQTENGGKTTALTLSNKLNRIMPVFNP